MSTHAVNILLVEDNPGDVVLTRESLNECKIDSNITVASDGVQALSVLDRSKTEGEGAFPDIILLDLNLPKLSGFAVLNAIKTDGILKRIPVMVLSSSQAPEDIIRCYDYHANCYVRKPNSIDGYINFARRIDEFWFSFAKLPSQA
ncbi:MAG: response regulator [Pseudomonadota bacterium]